MQVPASTANVGPAFDAVAVALGISLEVSDTGDPALETHPAVRAFRGAGGDGPLSVHARFPGGRGLGYSGAARLGFFTPSSCAVMNSSRSPSSTESTFPFSTPVRWSFTIRYGAST